MKKPAFLFLSLAGLSTASAQPAPSAPGAPVPAPVSDAAPAPASDPAPPNAPGPAADVHAASVASAPGWMIGLAPRVGAVVSTSKLGAMVIGGVQVDVAVALEHRLLIGVDFSFTRPSHNGSVMDPRFASASGNYAISESEVVLALLASYRFAGPDKRLVPWAGIGPMIHLLKSTETTSIAPGDNTATSTEPGFELAGGADYKAGPGYLAGDLRFAYSKLDHTITGSTNAGKITLGVGYRFIF